MLALILDTARVKEIPQEGRMKTSVFPDHGCGHELLCMRWRECLGRQENLHKYQVFG